MEVSTESLLHAPALVDARARTGKTADIIDGVKPRLVVEPETGRIHGVADRRRATAKASGR